MLEDDLYANVSNILYCRYKSINTESGAFKSKLSPLVGPLILLRAVGFEKGQEEEEGKLVYSG
jgi:hypothetical protein